MEKNGYPNPFKYVELFKVSRNIDNVLKLSAEDIKKIIGQYTIKGEKEYRNITILYTLFYTGMRSSELINLKFKHLLNREGNYFIKLEETKSGKEQYKSIYPTLVEKLLEYKKYKQMFFSISDENIEEQYIFNSSTYLKGLGYPFFSISLYRDFKAEITLFTEVFFNFLSSIR